MSARDAASPIGRHTGPLPGALLAWWLTVASAAVADDAGVRIDCERLPSERAAEIESRVRASLLTSELATTIDISCIADRVEVRASAGERSAQARATPREASWRDDVLVAVDEALRQLAATKEGEPPFASTPKAASTEPEPALQPSPPAASANPATAPSPPPHPPKSPARAGTELLAAIQLEAWRHSPAWGGVLGVARRAPPFRYSLRAGLLRPVSQDAAFQVHEFGWSLGLGYEPSFAAGLRVSLSAGASLLLVSPSGTLISRSGTTSVSAFADAELGRSFWLDRLAFEPALGLRWFPSERGVRLDSRARFTLGGLLPRLSVGLSYRLD